MARAGRKRKAGARNKAGRLIAIGGPRLDRGTAELRLHRALRAGPLDPATQRLWQRGKAEEAAAAIGMGDHGQAVDAVGRAWLAGLLDHPARDGAAMRDAGRVLFKLYWAHYAELAPSGGLYRELAGRGVVRSGAAGATGDIERAAQLEAALNRRLAILDDCGRDVRRAVESLCVDHHFEFGPAWLDRLIAARRDGRPAGEEDRRRIEAAVLGLAALA
ncbi:hypothetical protein GG804_20265 [Sphingomonas histidinilytica]|jgi:hypothetical protein|uniref:Uncharacterized protein n=1 Tax=Rhizorhabdus histidinilytica TaxID=439228 RepID=A0A1T5CT16_9SPHN|nr:hypothetical protein [Rhizorhabdus histidinilytica]MBO9379109.1 hypothetical protein [Rhizorhabdus histidinilytica]QEH79021.1 hypothetical protein EIK56_13005 [Sphingomonas sp. C8-2]SKB62625.1 hypothetical protein SAMN06295920_104296 [Rhizorhabdus histidinilytica]